MALNIFIHKKRWDGGREGGGGGGGEREGERERERERERGEREYVCIFVVVDDTFLVFLRRMRLMCSSFKTFHLCLLILRRCQES